MNTTQRQVVSVRIHEHHLAELRRLAERNSTTVSRLVAKCVADQLEPSSQQVDPSGITTNNHLGAAA